MNTFEKIENDINAVKEWNQEAGDKLHAQMFDAQNSEWSTEELAAHIKSENDVADEFYDISDYRHEEIRNIQDSIINFYAR